jgi:hypothetical protein
MLLDVFGSEEALRRMASVHPLGRIGRSEEIADAVEWLFSDRSSYYTGQSLTIDGGLTAQRPSAPADILEERIPWHEERLLEQDGISSVDVPSRAILN